MHKTFRHFVLSLTLLMTVGVSSCTARKNTTTIGEPITDTLTLKGALGDGFLVGTALNLRQISQRDSVETDLIVRNFNAVVAENCMKSEVLAPRQGVYDFRDADRLIDFAEKNGMTVTGHALIWHEQCPRWLFRGEDGGEVSRDELIARMRTYIYDVLDHFRGRIKGWDVVNEAILEDGSFRQSKFYEIIGPEFIELAFRFAHEADPDVELYYNDFGMTDPGRRDGVIALIRRLKAAGLRIDAVGLQSHMGLTFPDLKEYERTLEMYAAEGVKVMATELDMTVLPMPDPSYFGAAIDKKFEYQSRLNPYADGLPDSVARRLNNRYAELMQIYERHADIVDRVTFWGVRDGDSWKNNWPVRGRRDYPLPINRDGTLKDFVRQVYQQRPEAAR
jgi:endo-1,4-beta-xylanase